MTAPPTAYAVRPLPIITDNPPAAYVEVGGWWFVIWLEDAECTVIAHDGDAEIIGGSIQEVLYGVLDEYPADAPAEVQYLRDHLYAVTTTLRDVLWALADQSTTQQES